MVWYIMVYYGKLLQGMLNMLGYGMVWYGMVSYAMVCYGELLYGMLNMLGYDVFFIWCGVCLI